MEKVECARDGRAMFADHQSFPQGVPTYRFRCPGCGGMADMQIRDGKFVQVRLTDEDFRPDAVKPNERLHIEPAYTVGGPGSQTPRIEPPVPAYRVGGPPIPIGPNDPRHPNNIRKRILGRG